MFVLVTMVKRKKTYKFVTRDLCYCESVGFYDVFSTLLSKLCKSLMDIYYWDDKYIKYYVVK